jgi:membrane protein
MTRVFEHGVINGRVDFNKDKLMSPIRGQNADTPQQVPLLGWWDILQRTVKNMLDDNLSLIAAGVGFYFLLAVFPMMAALISAYGLLVSPTELQQHLTLLIGIIPEQSRELIQNHISLIMDKSETALGTSALLSGLFAVWSASKGAQAMITSSNIAYKQKQKRGFVMMVILRFSLTLGAVLILALALFSIALMPMLFSYIGLKNYSTLFSCVV